MYALVTGATRGIGRHTALALADAGLDVAIAARTVHEGDGRVAARVAGDGPRGRGPGQPGHDRARDRGARPPVPAAGHGPEVGRVRTGRSRDRARHLGSALGPGQQRHRARAAAAVPRARRWPTSRRRCRQLPAPGPAHPVAGPRDARGRWRARRRRRLVQRDERPARSSRRGRLGTRVRRVEGGVRPDRGRAQRRVRRPGPARLQRRPGLRRHRGRGRAWRQRHPERRGLPVRRPGRRRRGRGLAVTPRPTTSVRKFLGKTIWAPVLAEKLGRRQGAH